jgi:hypothetical protein
MAEETPEKRGPGQPTKYNGTLPERVDLFIEKCKSEDKLPTHAGLAVFLGISKASVANYANQYKEFLDSLGILNAKQEEMLVNRGLKNEYNSTVCKLMLCSNHGYTERTDTTSGGEPIKPTVVDFSSLATKKEFTKEESKPEPQDDELSS